MKRALAVIAYSRISYFEPVLQSVLSQMVGGRPIEESYDIFVFQDGLLEGEAEENRKGHEKIAELLRNLHPGIRVHRQTRNLSVARHFDFIEKLLFDELRYDVAVFCEDDMILAPGYMSAMDMLANKFHADERVGMFSANPGNAARSLDDQRANRKRYSPMEHNWGFGLSATFWRRRQRFVELYLKWLDAFPYRQRPSKDIFQWLEASEFVGRSSSQDYVKSCATTALGAVKLATYTNFGLPIGEIGLHSTPKLFKSMGFDKTVVFDEFPTSMADLDDKQFRELWEVAAGQHLKDPLQFDPAAWSIRLERGDLDPQRLIEQAVATRDAIALATESDVAACYKLFLGRLPENQAVVKSRSGLPVKTVMSTFFSSGEFSSKVDLRPLLEEALAALRPATATAAASPPAKPSPPRKWKAADILSMPHLPENELRLFQSLLRTSRHYLEYGSGGSTVLAARSGVETIRTVDSDRSFLDAVIDRVRQDRGRSRVQSFYVNIGPTGDWGVPTDPSCAVSWPQYCSAPWRSSHTQSNAVDLILIDGRFRVASFLTSLLNAAPGTTILFDDYVDRPNYHVVEKHIKPELIAGRMAKFVVPQHKDLLSIANETLEYCTDQA